MKYFTPDQMTQDMFEGSSVCHYEISKSETQELDLDRLDEFMSELLEYGSLPRQKVLFSFAGYDADERELIFIPEVVKYAKALISQHPYFWYYATPFNSEFFFLVLLLEEQNQTIATIPLIRKFHIKTDKDKVMGMIRIMGINLNIFGEEIDDIEGAVESLKVWSDKILVALGFK